MLTRKSRHLFILATLWLLLAAFSLPNMIRVRAATLTVTTLNDTGIGSLRDAISNALAGDTVVFAPGLTGTILLFGGTINLTRNITIIGNPGIILDGRDAAVIFATSANITVRLDNLILQRGLGSDGGAMNSSAALTLNNCTIRNNHATNRGGALFINNAGSTSSLTMNNTTIRDNEAAGEGGGIFDLGLQASTITSSLIAGNMSGGLGGGIRHVSGQTLTINSSTITGNQIANTASLSGGGIASQSAVLNINDSTISGNKAHFAGGIYISDIGQPATLNLTRSLVAGNTAVSDGGGMFVFGAKVNSLNSTFAHNLAGAGTGGGISIQNSGAGTAGVDLINNTIAYNRSVTNGGGITLISGVLSMRNTLIAGNISGANSDLNAAFTSNGFNLVQTRGTSSGYIASDLANGTNPTMQNLLYNGGPTNTINLQAGSPAINVIPAANCGGIVTDQRGYRRPANNCDIGAVEVNGIVPTATATPSQIPSATSTITATPTLTATPSITNTATNTPIPPRPDTIGVYKDGIWYLRNSNTTGPADIITNFGVLVTDYPVTGDWNGDGIDTIGLYRSDTGFFALSNDNVSPSLAYSVLLGNPGDTPFSGKWIATATHDGIGVFRPSNGILYEKNELTSGFDDYFAIFGNPGDTGLAGDWDGNGLDSVAVYRPSGTRWFLSNNPTPSGITFSDIDYVWDIGSQAALKGDWNGDGSDTGAAFSSGGLFSLNNQNASPTSLIVFAFGPSDAKPISGKWSAPSAPNRAGIYPNSGGYVNPIDGGAGD